MDESRLPAPRDHTPAAESRPRGRLFTPLACWLMFGVPAASILGIAAIKLPRPAAKPSDAFEAFTFLLSFAALGMSAIGGSAGWVVAARRRWGCDPFQLIGFAALGALAGGAIYTAADAILFYVPSAAE